METLYNNRMLSHIYFSETSSLDLKVSLMRTFVGLSRRLIYFSA